MAGGGGRRGYASEREMEGDRMFNRKEMKEMYGWFYFSVEIHDRIAFTRTAQSMLRTVCAKRIFVRK